MVDHDKRSDFATKQHRINICAMLQIAFSPNEVVTQIILLQSLSCLRVRGTRVGVICQAICVMGDITWDLTAHTPTYKLLADPHPGNQHLLHYKFCGPNMPQLGRSTCSKAGERALMSSKNQFQSDHSRYLATNVIYRLQG